VTVCGHAIIAIRIRPCTHRIARAHGGAAAAAGAAGAAPRRRMQQQSPAKGIRHPQPLVQIMPRFQVLTLLGTQAAALLATT
jgi:hypothetical protein